MIHHDHDNSSFWDTRMIPYEDDEKRHIPNLNFFNILLDLVVPYTVLTTELQKSIHEGQHCEELKANILWYACSSIINFLRTDCAVSYSMNQSMIKAISLMVEYGVSEKTALHTFNVVESAVTRCLMNVMPELENLQKYSVFSYKVIQTTCLYLVINYNDD